MIEYQLQNIIARNIFWKNIRILKFNRGMGKSGRSRCFWKAEIADSNSASPTNFMQTFLFSLTWFLALLIPAMSLAAIFYIQISVWQDKRYALKEIRKTKKEFTAAGGIADTTDSKPVA